MKLIRISALALLLIASSATVAKTLHTVASFSVLGDIVQQIGGDNVKVTTLVGPNGDPHTFEPSPKDSQVLHQADVVFISGLGLEGWIGRLVKASGYPNEVVVASTGVETQATEEDGKIITDPHAWNSAKNGAIYARNIMNALIAADPEEADGFRQRGESYIQKLETLDSWAKKTFEAVPVSHRKLLTSHDAFGYFGTEYGVTFLSPVGFSTESEASAGNVAKLISQIKQEGIKTYFIENQTDPRLVKQIAAASGAKPGGVLYPEALSLEDGPASTYEAAFKHNVDAIAASMK